MVKLKVGTLPWIEHTDETTTTDIDKIIKIREENPPKILCKGFPDKFVNLFEELLIYPQNERPKYGEILICLEELKKSCENLNNEGGFKFQWIKYFVDYISKNRKLTNNYSIDYIKYFISIIGLNFKKYIDILIN